MSSGSGKGIDSWRRQCIHVLEAAKSGSCDEFKTHLLSALVGAPRSLDNLLQLQDVNGRSVLSWAAGNGHLDLIQYLLSDDIGGHACVETDHGSKQGSAPERNESDGFHPLEGLIFETDFQNRTPLSWAAENRHSAVVKCLLSRYESCLQRRYNLLTKHLDGNVHDTEIDETSPFSGTTGNDHNSVSNIPLHDKDMRTHLPDEEGRTPLSWAAGNGHAEVVKLLATKDLPGLTLLDYRLWSPLAWATHNRHEAIRQILVEEIVPGYRANDMGEKASLVPWIEMHGGDLAVLSLLPYDETGAFYRQVLRRQLLGLPAEYTFLRSLGLREGMRRSEVVHSVLLAASAQGLSELIKSLIQMDSHPIDLYSPLPRLPTIEWRSRAFMGRRKKQIPKEERLESRPVKLWQTCLLLAFKNHHNTVVEIFLNDLRMHPGSEGDTLLTIAASQGDQSAVVAIIDGLDTNIELDAKTRSGATAFWLAVKNNHVGVANLLLSTRRVDPNHIHQGRTPLMEAASQGSVDMVKALLADSKVDVNYRGGDGNTALGVITQEFWRSPVILPCVLELLWTPDVEWEFSTWHGETKSPFEVAAEHFQTKEPHKELLMTLYLEKDAANPQNGPICRFCLLLQGTLVRPFSRKYCPPLHNLKRSMERCKLCRVLHQLALRAEPKQKAWKWLELGGEAFPHCEVKVIGFDNRLKFKTRVTMTRLPQGQSRYFKSVPFTMLN